MDFMTWNMDPVLISLGGLKIHWYGLMFMGGFLIGYQIMVMIYKKEQQDPEKLDRLLWHLLLGTIIGARLGHVLFYDPGYYFSNPLEILAIWKGGLASHGGAIGVLLALYLYQRKSSETYLWLLDRIAIPAALAACFIRIGNLFNSEIIGQPTTVPWAIIFERIDSLPRHPTQLYESLSYAITFIVLVMLYKKLRSNGGVIIGAFLVCVFSSRFVIEFYKTKQATYATDLWLNTGQMLSIPFVIAGLVLIFMSCRKA
ncbi:Prolipoprotein diacylglyceryl transferase [hydrothermal vent metagenome]|uniref:Prolipoprotein diacylglyceryl transferase n=1 Tax=hydrothermal vent metagenome TaxID=652676 RepID=A0A3B0Z9C4_9ZZZZ